MHNRGTTFVWQIFQFNTLARPVADSVKNIDLDLTSAEIDAFTLGVVEKVNQHTPASESSACIGRYGIAVCIAAVSRCDVESGARVLIKRAPGNRGPSECGTTHEATSGMSS